MKTFYRFKSAKRLVDREWQIEVEIIRKSFWPWKKDQIQTATFIGKHFWYQLPDYTQVGVASNLDRYLCQWAREAEMRQKYKE